MNDANFRTDSTTPLPADHLRPLRIVSLTEGFSLLMLVGFAVPLKHLAGLPIAASIIGPLHGLIFMIYLRMVVTTAFSEAWSTAQILRIVILAFVPFGAFFNAKFLQRKSADVRQINIALRS